MTGEAQILMWWLLFGGTHVIGSTVPVRTALIARLGTGGFKGLYSAVSFATFVPLIWVYFHNVHAGTQLFAPSASMRSVTEALMVLALLILVQSLMTPSPLTTQSEMSGEYPAEPRGIQRVSRHPMNLAFSLFGFAHMLSNPFVGDWTFFGGFVVYGMISAVHQDLRTLASGRPEVASFQEATSVVPFAAILAGKQKLALGEYSQVGFAVGALLAAVLWFFHGTWFGGYVG